LFLCFLTKLQHQGWPPMGTCAEPAALRTLGTTHILALTSD
jgi:hypothetical protein